VKIGAAALVPRGGKAGGPMSTPGTNSKHWRLRSPLSAFGEVFTSAFGRRLPQWQVWVLRMTLVIDGLAVLVLAFWELELITTVMQALGVALLLATSVANLWAFRSLVRVAPSWSRDAALAQGFVALLAVYIFVMDFRSYEKNRWTLIISACAGLFAIAWVLRLGRGSVSVHWSKSTAAIAALIPLAGLVQFWLQSEYLPSLTTPMVDVSTELTPTGRTGSIIHLSAKVTFHNRGSFTIMAPAGLMRITAYPRDSQRRPRSPCSTEVPPVDYDPVGNVKTFFTPTLETVLDPTGAHHDAEFRDDENLTSVHQCDLLEASLLGGPSSFMSPGATIITQEVIDIDADTVRLARLSVSAVFITERRFKDVKACWPTKDTSKSLYPSNWPVQASRNHDADNFYSEAGHLWPGPGLTEALCMDYELAPRSVVQELVSGPPVLRVQIVTGQWLNDYNEYPLLYWWYGTSADIDKSQGEDETAKIRRSNPVGGVSASAEYAPGQALPLASHDSEQRTG
jgi:hypothetical protein